RGGQHVNAFVNPFMADGLSAEQTASLRREQDFHGDGLRAGIVARMRARVKMNRLKGNGGATKRFFICACATGGEIEQPQDGCAPGVFVSGWAAEDIVGGSTTLAIRRNQPAESAPIGPYLCLLRYGRARPFSRSMRNSRYSWRKPPSDVGATESECGRSQSGEEA